MGAVGVAWAEVSRRWVMIPIALLLGIVPVAITGGGPYGRQHQLAEVCMLGGVLLSWILAFVTGMALIGKPLHDGRLSFLFTRPLGGLSIAGGKVLGGLALVVAVEMMLLAPPQTSAMFDFDASQPLFACGMALVFFAAGLVVGVLARSRSRWLIADAIGATIASLLAVSIVGRINAIDRWMSEIAKYTPEEAQPIFDREGFLLRTLAAAGVVVLLAAVVVAIAIGRTDRERVHRALSITMWSSVIVLGIAGLVAAQWGIL
jgi:hypothetical protein